MKPFLVHFQIALQNSGNQLFLILEMVKNPFFEMQISNNNSSIVVADLLGTEAVLVEAGYLIDDRSVSRSALSIGVARGC